MAAPVCEFRKRTRVMQQQQQDEEKHGRDRISELPDEILCNILTLLPIIKDVVKTSVLSKRWKRVCNTVWPHTRALRVQDTDYLTSLNYPDMYIYQRIASFTKLVTRVIPHLRLLRKLELGCYYPSCTKQQWIDIVTNKLHNLIGTLEELDLAMRDSTHLVTLPYSVFTSEKLVALKINCNAEQLLTPVPSRRMNEPPSSPLPSSLLVCLPCLKVFHLCTFNADYRYRRMDLSSVQNVLTGSPVLEELLLSGHTHSYTGMCLKSWSLKRLNLRVSCHNSRIEIDASNLEELDLHFNMNNQDQISIANNSLPSMTRVTLAITTRGHKRPEISYGTRFHRLLAQTSDTKYLFLSSHVMMNLEYSGFYQQPPMFNNLMDLKLDICFYDSCHILPWLLASSPNLVRVSICRVDDEEEKPIAPDQLQRTPNCSTMIALHNLEKVDLKDFRGSRHEMKLVRYLLGSAPVLKDVAFSFTNCSVKTQSQLLQSVAMLPKASAACRVTGF